MTSVTPGVVELLQQLVRIPSESGCETALVDFLEARFRELGWEPVREERNLHTVLGEDGPVLLFNSHTDTVPVGEGWTRPPLEAAIEDGRIHGRGSNDAKGCLAAMIVGAARAFRHDPPKGRLIVSATYEEETSGKGLQTLLPRLPRLDAAVVGEPTGLDPAISQKGLLLLEIFEEGRSAHVAWGGGVNAIEKAARDVLALGKVRFDREHPSLGLPSLHVTQITGGARHNVIPDACKLVVDIRTTPMYTPDEIVAMIEPLVEGRVQVRSRRFLAVATDPEEPIIRAALAARPAGKPFASPTMSDWVWLAGIPTVKVGPGDSHRSHTPDEYVTVSELEEGAAFYESLIRTYFR